MLTAQNLKQYRTTLHAMRARLIDHAAQIREETSGGIDGAPREDFPDRPIDPLDRASQQTELAVRVGLAENEAHLRTEIDAALERLDAGTYGVCEDCGAVIAAKRLEAVPYAKFCIRCERLAEQPA
ncbi:MAG: TraR/DksA C4-type zinc finger protein [Planctomycetes bacterium]|nr:TraR/DksA C4-type zinc finger protein [Planctomycetota bacterium]